MPTTPNKSQQLKKEAMIAALEKRLGIVTTAAKEVGINRWTHYDWLKNDDEYRKAVAEIENVSLDFAESQLMKQMEGGNTAATIFYLKTKGKHRGYVERVEHTGPEGETIRVIIEDATRTKD